MATPAERSSAARIAANTSWARTPDRSERTAPARAASPVTYGYWVNRLTEEGVIREKDIPAAAENAYRAYMAQLSKKAKAARAAKAAKNGRIAA